MGANEQGSALSVRMGASRSPASRLRVHGLAWTAWALAALLLETGPSCIAAPPAADAAERQDLLPGVYLLRGCVNTAVFERNGRTLLIDPGELVESPSGGPVDWVLVTHHHRDQATRVDRLLASGARLVVPAGEEQLFADAEGFWKSQSHVWSKFRPHRFTLRQSVKVARTVKGGDVLEWEGLKFEVIDTPGHTGGSVTYLVNVDGQAE